MHVSISRRRGEKQWFKSKERKFCGTFRSVVTQLFSFHTRSLRFSLNLVTSFYGLSTSLRIAFYWFLLVALYLWGG